MIKDLLLFGYTITVTALMCTLGSLMIGCTSKPYTDFDDVREGNYFMYLKVSNDTEKGLDGKAVNVGKLWLLSSNTDFCVIVHEVAHVVYQDYHYDGYNECKRLTK